MEPHHDGGLAALGRRHADLAAGHFVQWLYLPYVGLPPEETGYGLLLLPFIVLWGAVTLASVVAAIEPAPSRLRLPFIALGKALSVSAQFVNLGRLIVLSVLMTIPLFAEFCCRRTCARTTYPTSTFWADIPIDMLALGPIQAIATVFYVDFLRRAKR